MAKDRRAKVKGRTSYEPFLGIPKKVVDSEQFNALSGAATKLLVQAANQYNYNNNGNLCISWAVMRGKGWRSPETLNRARRELEDSLFLLKTRQGGLHKCSLFAVTWVPIDECNGKHDHPSERLPSDLWKNAKPNTETVLGRYGNRTNGDQKEAA